MGETMRRGDNGADVGPYLSLQPASVGKVEMRRRKFSALLATAATVAGSRGGRAQQKPIPTIGFLSILSSAKSAPFHDVFVAGLRDLGYVDGRTIRI